MNLRYLIARLLGNDQVIQKLADSYPVRRAAKYSVYLWHRGKELGNDRREKFMESLRNSDPTEQLKDGTKDTTGRLLSFKDTFKRNLDNEIKDLERKQRK